MMCCICRVDIILCFSSGNWGVSSASTGEPHARFDDVSSGNVGLYKGGCAYGKRGALDMETKKQKTSMKHLDIMVFCSHLCLGVDLKTKWGERYE
jgi:hypothetical protein